MLSCLPPMLTLVGDAEVMLDEALVLSKAAESAGVRVELAVFPRMWHVFPMYSEACHIEDSVPLAEANGAIQFCADFCKSLSA